MSKRTERRAAERAARKTAYQQLRAERTGAQPAAAPQPPTPAETITQTEDLLARAQAFFQSPEAKPTPTPPISEAQLAANRANAQLSSGPKSQTGKAVSSQNALKHGLTSRAVVLASEDPSEYTRQLDLALERFQPATEEELRLVQSIVDNHWRMVRLQRTETALLRKGELEFANKFEDHDPADRSCLILAEIYLKYEKSLRNLNTHEARLRRCIEKDQAELARLQTDRKRQELLASEAPSPVSHPPFTARSAQNGFVFSTAPNADHSPHKKAA